MNNALMIAELSEARAHLERLEAQLAAAPLEVDGDAALGIYFGHILEHLCLAFHYRKKTNEEINNLAQEEFESLANSIPNFTANFSLLENLDIPEK